MNNSQIRTRVQEEVFPQLLQDIRFLCLQAASKAAEEEGSQGGEFQYLKLMDIQGMIMSLSSVQDIRRIQFPKHPTQFRRQLDGKLKILPPDLAGAMKELKSMAKEGFSMQCGSDKISNTPEYWGLVTDVNLLIEYDRLYHTEQKR